MKNEDTQSETVEVWNKDWQSRELFLAFKSQERTKRNISLNTTFFLFIANRRAFFVYRFQIAIGRQVETCSSDYFHN